jgi:beta-fructofuranosidase
MVVSRADEGFVSFYTSENLKDWKLRSHFALPSITGTNFECPNFVQMPMPGYAGSEDIYVLVISFGAQSPLNHGSVTRYFPGSFNGTHFTPSDNRTDRYIDFGPDNYALQFFHNTPAGDPLVSIAWAANLAYCIDIPTGWREGWRGMMTLPREHFLVNISDRGYELVSRPYDLSPMFDAVIADISGLRDGESSYGFAHLPSGTVLFDANFTLLSSARELLKSDLVADRPSTHAFEFSFSSSASGERVVCRLALSPASRAAADDTPQANFLCDRSLTMGDWYNPHFVPTMSRSLLAPMRHAPLGSQPQPQSRTQWSIQSIMDRSILEVFLNGGEDVGTMTMFPRRRFDRVVVLAEGLEGVVDVSVRLTGLRSGWTKASSSAFKNEKDTGDERGQDVFNLDL